MKRNKQVVRKNTKNNNANQLGPRIVGGDAYSRDLAYIKTLPGKVLFCKSLELPRELGSQSEQFLAEWDRMLCDFFLKNRPVV